MNREVDPRPRRDPQERPRLPQRGLRAARRRYLDRHRDRRDGRPERPDLAHRLPRRMRPQRRKTPHRPGPGTIPTLERQPRRPPRLGTATPQARLNPCPANHHGAAHTNQPRRLWPCPLTGLPNTYPVRQQKQLRVKQLAIQSFYRQATPAAFTEDTQY